ncbi:hypothetical protein QJS04_geneDACA022369 [Acorus gramineus]|uniref:Uncharacterized protein n=1 Tax=Acorus gramineus TaxID=55184 RepID=A0AAV9B259_ACOGR|nr:hypothetical protein QJS04_geneDACA022369 [Acorus gramineus]
MLQGAAAAAAALALISQTSSNDCTPSILYRTVLIPRYKSIFIITFSFSFFRLGYNSGFTEILSNDYMFEAFTSSLNGNPVFKEENDLNTNTHYGIAPQLNVSASACTDNEDMRRKRGSTGHLVINEMNTKRGKASIGGGGTVTRQAKVMS